MGLAAGHIIFRQGSGRAWLVFLEYRMQVDYLGSVLESPEFLSQAHDGRTRLSCTFAPVVGMMDLRPLCPHADLFCVWRIH